MITFQALVRQYADDAVKAGLDLQVAARALEEVARELRSAAEEERRETLGLKGKRLEDYVLDDEPLDAAYVDSQGYTDGQHDAENHKAYNESTAAKYGASAGVYRTGYAQGWAAAHTDPETDPRELPGEN